VLLLLLLLMMAETCPRRFPAHIHRERRNTALRRCLGPKPQHVIEVSNAITVAPLEFERRGRLFDVGTRARVGVDLGVGVGVSLVGR
jgi:hypothetical protein